MISFRPIVRISCQLLHLKMVSNTCQFTHLLSASQFKFWRTDKFGPDGAPLLLRKLKVFNERFPEVAVTCMGVLEDLTELAVGLGNGTQIFLCAEKKI
jgi:hypothetical protein